MRSWLDVQESIAERDYLAEIDLTNITPVRIGGYAARPFSDVLQLMEEPRTQSIKGLWRWWARAILAGAILRSQRLLPSSIGEINKMVSELLGYKNKASEFFIRIVFDPKNASIIEPDSSKLTNIPRVRLLMRGKKKERRQEKYQEKYYEKLSLKLIVGCRKGAERYDKDTVMFALSSLIVSLVFGGIGSLINRGFGKLKICNIKSITPSLKDEINKLTQLIRNLYEQNNEIGVTERLRDLLSVSIEYAVKYISLRRTSKIVKVSGLPPYSVLLLDYDPEVFRLETICITRKNPIEVLEWIGRSTLKYEWKKVKTGLPSKSSGKAFHTWVLGLPRHQELPYEKNGRNIRLLTGYILDNEKGKRRQSPIGFTILECSGGLAIVIYGFLTSEFAILLKGYNNLTLQHIGIHSTKSSIKKKIGKIKEIKKTRVLNDLIAEGIYFPTRSQKIDPSLPIENVYKLCFDAAWSFVKEIISGGCYR